jgi:hypothetical protein
MIFVDTRKTSLPQNHINRNDLKVSRLVQFRQELYDSFHTRADVLMNLIDAICSNTHAKSIAELSLNPIFRYQYPSIYDAIDQFFNAGDSDKPEAQRHNQDIQLMEMCLQYVPPPMQQRFWLFGLDVTPQPRPYAKTLADRTVVYHPNPVLSNKPIALGHQYAALVYFPEKASLCSPPWVVPLSMRRVKSEEKATDVHAQQIAALMTTDGFADANRLCVCVADSTLGAVTFLGQVQSHQNLVTIARTRSNRVFYRRPKKRKNKRGHPIWYGDRFDLKDDATWAAPDAVDSIETVTKRGRKLTIELQGWDNLLMRGTRDYPMHKSPFTLIRIVVTDENGTPVFKRPMWLTVIGERRDQLSLVEVWRAYRQRVDVEHFFRFGKQRLLTSAYQTPDVEHEQNWWQITQLAYLQLFVARELAVALPRPWERYLPAFSAQEVSSSMVMRDFLRIIGTIEPKPAFPKGRGKSPGRAKGERPKPRERQKVIRKSKKRVKSAA